LAISEINGKTLTTEDPLGRTFHGTRDRSAGDRGQEEQKSVVSRESTTGRNNGKAIGNRRATAGSLCVSGKPNAFRDDG